MQMQLPQAAAGGRGTMEPGAGPVYNTRSQGRGAVNGVGTTGQNVMLADLGKMEQYQPGNTTSASVPAIQGGPMPGAGYMMTPHPHWHEASRMGVTPAQGAGVMPGVHGPHAVAAPGVTQFTGGYRTV